MPCLAPVRRGGHNACGMSTREAVHALVDALPEEELLAARRLLETLRAAGTSEAVEDALDEYAIRALRREQSGDEAETLNEFGHRLRLE